MQKGSYFHGEFQEGFSVTFKLDIQGSLGLFYEEKRGKVIPERRNIMNGNTTMRENPMCLGNNRKFGWNAKVETGHGGQPCQSEGCHGAHQGI